MFKDIPGYEGIYEVSDAGVVRTVKGKQTHSVLRGLRTWEQRELKLKTDKKGYKRVSLYKDKICKTFLVHRLVAMAFLEHIPGHDLINHIDCNPSNNCVENLEWCTSHHNVNHAFDNGLMSSKKVTLIDSNTGEERVFRSMSKASLFLGKNTGYISCLTSRRKYQTGQYKIVFNNNS